MLAVPFLLYHFERSQRAIWVFVALLISSIFEGFAWQALTFVGVAISVAGNVLVLRK